MTAMPTIFSPNLRGVPFSVSKAASASTRLLLVTAVSSATPFAEKVGAAAFPSARAASINN